MEHLQVDVETVVLQLVHFASCTCSWWDLDWTVFLLHDEVDRFSFYLLLFDPNVHTSIKSFL